MHQSLRIHKSLKTPFIRIKKQYKIQILRSVDFLIDKNSKKSSKVIFGLKCCKSRHSIYTKN